MSRRWTLSARGASSRGWWGRTRYPEGAELRQGKLSRVKLDPDLGSSRGRAAAVAATEQPTAGCAFRKCCTITGRFASDTIRQAAAEESRARVTRARTTKARCSPTTVTILTGAPGSIACASTRGCSFTKHGEVERREEVRPVMVGDFERYGGRHKVR